MAAEYIFTDATKELMSNSSSGNDTTYFGCSLRGILHIPKTEELFAAQPYWNLAILVIGLVFTATTYVIFVEEVLYIVRFFKPYGRRVKTIWVLAIYPVFSLAALLGLMVPRAGTIVDLCSNVYFSTCLYQFVRLMIDYMGGSKLMLDQLQGTRVALRGPPFCCCCFCLPTVPFSRSLFSKIQTSVYQVTIVRPFIHFLAAVLWANGNYVPGLVTLDNAYPYIVVLNLTSTFTAIYGLLLLQKSIKEHLQSYHLAGKFLSLQLVLLLTIIPNIIINVLVTAAVIPCSDLLPSKARGERIYHMFVILLMLPLGLMGRRFYRRKREGKRAHTNGAEMQKLNVTEDKGIMTSIENVA